MCCLAGNWILRRKQILSKHLEAALSTYVAEDPEQYNLRHLKLWLFEHNKTNLENFDAWCLIN